jgi:hypothetical protein
MIAPYNSIIKSEEVDFKDYLKKIHLFSIFKSLAEEFSDSELFKGVVVFIAYGFSIESDMLLTQGYTWDLICKRVYEKSGLPDNEELFDQVANLKSDSVRESIENWLRFQNDDNFTNFTHYRDLRRQFLALSLSDMKKATGEIDIEAKMKAAVYSKDLLKMMEDARETFIQNHPKLRGAVEAVNKVNNNIKNSRGPGSYAVR